MRFMTLYGRGVVGAEHTNACQAMASGIGRFRDGGKATRFRPPFSSSVQDSVSDLPDHHTMASTSHTFEQAEEAVSAPAMEADTAAAAPAEENAAALGKKE